MSSKSKSVISNLYKRYGLEGIYEGHRRQILIQTDTFLIKSLKKKKYIRTKKKGIPGKRWVQINVKNILEDLDKAVSS